MKPTILPYKGIYPKIHETAFIAPNATIIGDVEIGEYSSVWPGCVIRGDVNIIRIGKRTNVQDGTIIHVTRPSIAGESGQTIIGDNITIGHSATIHACTLEDESFIGMGSIILDGAIVKKGGMLAAGALLAPNKQLPGGQIWAGNPAKYMRDMKDAEKAFIKISAENYVNDAKAHKESY